MEINTRQSGLREELVGTTLSIGIEPLSLLQSCWLRHGLTEKEYVSDTTNLVDAIQFDVLQSVGV